MNLYLHCLEEGLTHGSVQFSSVTQSCPTLCDPMNPEWGSLHQVTKVLEFQLQHQSLQ